MEKKDIYLGQSTIEQVENIDDNFIKLFNGLSNIGEAVKADETIIEANKAAIEKINSDLANYYNKTETDNKITTLQNQISQIPKFEISVVSTLPTSNISTTTIYLVPSTNTETNNIYTEYIYTNNKWEIIGTQTLDLSGYALKSEIPTSVNEMTGGTINGNVNVAGSLGLGGYSRKLNARTDGLYYGDTKITLDNMEDWAKNHSQTRLTNEDLNELNDEYYVGWYYADYGNTCTNTPTATGLYFMLEVGALGSMSTDSDYPSLYYQRLISSYGGGTVFYRVMTPAGSSPSDYTWLAWKRVATGVINDGKLTIQKNGTTVEEFTANQSDDVVANIEVPTPSDTAPKMDGAASAGSDETFARADHVHPTDTSRASTAVATTSANGLMSATDKKRLDTLYGNEDDNVIRRTVTVATDDSKYTTFTINGTTLYGYPIGDDEESYDITGVWNGDGYGIVYQEYRTDSFNYVLVASKMAMTISYMVRFGDYLLRGETLWQ